MSKKYAGNRRCFYTNLIFAMINQPFEVIINVSRLKENKNIKIQAQKQSDERAG